MCGGDTHGGPLPAGPRGQRHWPEAHPACGGRSQSPIDIGTRRALPDPSLPPLRPVGYGRPPAAAFGLANNGHTGERLPGRGGDATWGCL